MRKIYGKGRVGKSAAISGLSADSVRKWYRLRKIRGEPCLGDTAYGANEFAGAGKHSAFYMLRMGGVVW